MIALAVSCTAFSLRLSPTRQLMLHVFCFFLFAGRVAQTSRAALLSARRRTLSVGLGQMKKRLCVFAFPFYGIFFFRAAVSCFSFFCENTVGHADLRKRRCAFAHRAKLFATNVEYVRLSFAEFFLKKNNVSITGESFSVLLNDDAVLAPPSVAGCAHNIYTAREWTT